MKPDDFEEWLQRQPLRAVPVDWRQEILAASRRHSTLYHASQVTDQHCHPSGLRSRLLAILWPCPQAWAGLAALWLAILALNFSTAHKTDTVADQAPPSPEMITAFKEQQRLLVELIGPPEPPPAERPRPAQPRPRSQLQRPALRLGAFEHHSVVPT